MKRGIVFLMALLIAGFTQAQIIRAFTPRYTNTSVRGSIVYVSNSIISTSGIGTGSPGTGEVPPAGTSTDNPAAAINLDVDNVVTTLFNYGLTWKYWDANSRPANWETSGFNDTG